jgi:uncharacterized protein YndB with AHSA1/START domain
MNDEDRSQESLVMERLFDAPIGVVWEMWTRGEHFARWYGPDGATIPVADFDLRVGGTRRICMQVQTPDGPAQMWFTGEHLEVVQPVLLVYTESMSDEQGNVLPPEAMGMPPGHPSTTQVRVELQTVGDRTRLTLTHIGIPSESPGAAGWTMALDKLAARVGRQANR